MSFVCKSRKKPTKQMYAYRSKHKRHFGGLIRIVVQQCTKVGSDDARISRACDHHVIEVVRPPTRILGTKRVVFRHRPNRSKLPRERGFLPRRQLLERRSVVC